MADEQGDASQNQPLDPTGQWRWDGTQWVPTTPPTPPIGTPPAPKQTAPWWRKPWVLPTSVGILALVVGIGIGSASAGTKTKTVAGPERVVVSASPSPVPTIVATTVKVPVPGPTKVITKQVPQTYTQMGDGTYVVGTDIQPGVYKTAGPGPGGSCYWAVLNSLNTQDIADNGNIGGPTTIQVSGKALELDGGCTWAKIGSPSGRTRVTSTSNGQEIFGDEELRARRRSTSHRAACRLVRQRRDLGAAVTAT